MNELQIFENTEFGEVRVVEHEGQPWFVAKDVAAALGYADTDDAVRRHCNYAELFKPGELPGLEIGPRGMYFIPEPDVYRLVVRSALPTAKVFEKWVFEEVLPSIRKHGIYATENVVNQILDNPEFGIQLLTALKEEREARVNAEKRVAILSHVRKTYTTTEIAKELGFRSAVAFNRVLCEQHIQYKQNGTYVLYAEYAELGYVHIKQEVLENDKVVYHRRWTQLGREWLIGRFGIKAA